MGYRPPAGVRPPQLEGRRTGRPRGSRSHYRIWAEPIWGYQHRNDPDPDPPTPAAWLWKILAARYPDEIEEFLRAYERL